MTGRPVVTERELIAWVRRDFGIDLVSCQRAGGGTDAAASTWRADTRDHATLAVRVTAGTTSGVWLAALLALRGVRGVPMPWRTLDGAAWSTRAGLRLSVSTWVSDRVASDGRVTADQWRALGRLLAQVHGQELGGELTALLPTVDHDPVASAAASAQAVRDLPWTVVRHTAADDVTSALAATLAGSIDGLAQVASIAEGLAGSLTFADRTPVLCHGDPHLGNVLLGTDDVWLVDWDDAVRAPRERDLILAVGGVLTSWMVTAEQRDWFAQGYGPLDLDPELLHYYACVRAMEDALGFAHRVLDTERFDRAERLEAVQILRGVLSPDGIGRLITDHWTWPPA